jgi:hypothetical protein
MCVKNRLDVRVVSGDIDAYIVKRGHFLVTCNKPFKWQRDVEIHGCIHSGNSHSAVKFVIGHSDRKLI